MPDRRRVLVLIGTRPEAVKLAPVVLALGEGPRRLEARVALSGQHAHLVRPVLEHFGIEAHVDLAVGSHAQTLAGLTARALEAVDGLLERERPDALVVQGDTTTVFAGALAAFYRRVPVAHVEAGLRTGDLLQPFPEEFNRRAAAIVADLHLAPTPRARDALLAEGHSPSRIYVTGNTVTDALRLTVRQGGAEPTVVPLGREERQTLGETLGGGEFVLVEVHRRENLPHGIVEVAEAVAALCARTGLQALVSVHPNPEVREALVPRLSGAPGVHLVEPMDYPVFVRTVARARLVITDSGGLQEEAPSFGTPVVVARNHTERPEAAEAGLAVIAGTERQSLLEAADRMLARPLVRPAEGATLASPFGDGFASERIRDALEHALCGGPRPEDYVHAGGA